MDDVATPFIISINNSENVISGMCPRYLLFKVCIIINTSDCFRVRSYNNGVTLIICLWSVTNGEKGQCTI